jgi:hypothetical protein
MFIIMMRKDIFLVALALSFDLMIQAEGACLPWQVLNN